MNRQESNDKFEEKLKQAFAGYSPEPPEEVWDNVMLAIHPGKRTIIRQEKRMFHYLRSPLLWASLAAASVIILLVAGYLSLGGQRVIRGYAFAGDRKLCRGTAILFLVEDKTLPRDSVRYVRSAVVDKDGFFRFGSLDEGNYLLRVHPVQGSDPARQFQSSWYEQHDSHHNAILIRVSDQDIKADVHLLPHEP